MSACSAEPIGASRELAAGPARIPHVEPLARQIHDHILQMLGVALLHAELCRRFWGQAKDGQVVADLAGVTAALEEVTAASRELVTDLQLVEAWCRQGRDADEANRVHADLPPRTRSNRGPLSGRPEPVSSAGEVVLILGICLLQAELCRRFYQQGGETRALRELGILLERLERVVEMFRTVMETLRRALVLTRASRLD